MEVTTPIPTDFTQAATWIGNYYRCLHLTETVHMNRKGLPSQMTTQLLGKIKSKIKMSMSTSMLRPWHREEYGSKRKMDVELIMQPTAQMELMFSASELSELETWSKSLFRSLLEGTVAGHVQ
jgi:hypothetical protein